MLAAHLGRLRTELMLLQNPNDLLFGKSLALHRLALLKGQTPAQLGLNCGGKVTVHTAPADSEKALRIKVNEVRRDEVDIVVCKPLPTPYL
jgi:hypothetical protein